MNNTSFTEIKKNIEKFKKDKNVQDLKSFYESKSFFEILSIERRELSHSSFLAWLLDIKQTHNLNDFFIKQFIELIEKSKKYFTLADFRFLSQLSDKQYDVKSTSITKEKYIEKKNKKRRIDIEIEVVIQFEHMERTILFVIENKVDSKESEDQTLDYFEYYKNKNKNKETYFLYLSAISNVALKQKNDYLCECQYFIPINYQGIVDLLIEQALEKENITQNIQFVLREHLRALSLPSLKNDLSNLNYSIMALGKEEKKLLLNFWIENESLIRQAMYANSINEELPEEDRKTNENFLEKTKYGFEVRQKIGEMSRQNLLDNHLIDLCDAAYSNLHFGINQSFLLKKTQDPNCGLDKKGYTRYYKKQTYLIIGNEYLLCNHWTDKNIERFRDWAKTNSN